MVRYGVPLRNMATRMKIYCLPTPIFTSESMVVAQSKLPRLPVPLLNKTLETFVNANRQLVTAKELERTKKIISDFLQQGGLGQRLQEHLEERSKDRENWFAEWWLEHGYMRSRCPTALVVNPGIVLPRVSYRDRDGQIRFASKIITNLLKYKNMFDTETVPIESLKGKPMCMDQVYRVMSTCRIPGSDIDTVVTYPANRANPPQHITVAFKNHFFEVPVYDSDGNALSATAIYHQLNQVINMAPNETAAPVGILTTNNRDDWAEAYHCLIEDETNKKSLESIHRSIAMICIDHMDTPELNSDNDILTYTAEKGLHGGGSHDSSGNRWFDKTIQIIFGGSGIVASNYEHGPAEGGPVIQILDYCFQNLKTVEEPDSNTTMSVQTPALLQFNLTQKSLDHISAASNHIDSLISNIDISNWKFDGFGKTFIKNQKVSPDAFIQMAFQLAFYRMYDKPAAVYEAGSLRKYIYGRTEVIRSSTHDAFLFVSNFDKPGLSDSDRAELIRKAAISHSNYLKLTVDAKGCDRHLAGLKQAALDMGLNVPELFTDKLYSESQHYRLSTSQVPASIEGNMVFAPSCDDGYGLCYNPRADSLLIGVTAWKSCPDTDTTKFIETLHSSFMDMRSAMAKSSKSKL